MNKKGFTLIELLAVIVILAIIALIVTPIVSNIIASARNSANARSVEGHIDNIEYSIISSAFNEGKDIGFMDGTVAKEKVGIGSAYSISVPSNDTIECDSYVIEAGIVKTATNCTNPTAGWAKSYGYSATGGAVSN